MKTPKPPGNKYGNKLNPLKENISRYSEMWYTKYRGLVCFSEKGLRRHSVFPLTLCHWWP